MTVLRMDNVLLVVDDLEAVKAFFVDLGLELEGEAIVEGESVDRLIGLEGVRATIASMRTPDGHGRIELDKFHTPAALRGEPEDAPVNTLGLRRIMFAVDDIESVIGRLRAHGAELVGELVEYEADTDSAISAARRASSSGSPSNSRTTRRAESEVAGTPSAVDVGVLSDNIVFPILLSKDLDRSREFYRDVLGLEILREDPGDRIVFRCGGGGQLAVTASTVGTADSQTQLRGACPTSTLPSQSCGRVASGSRTYTAPDPETVDGIADMGHSWAAWFVDPSRNVLAVVQPKGWTRGCQGLVIAGTGPIVRLTAVVGKLLPLRSRLRVGRLGSTPAAQGGLGGHQDLAGSRHGAQPGGDVDGVAERGQVGPPLVPDGADPGHACGDPGTDRYPRSSPIPVARSRVAAQRPRDRGRRVTLARDQREEERHDLVTDELVDASVVVEHRLRRCRVEAVDQRAERSWWHAVRQGSSSRGCRRTGSCPRSRRRRGASP